MRVALSSSLIDGDGPLYTAASRIAAHGPDGQCAHWSCWRPASAVTIWRCWHWDTLVSRGLVRKNLPAAYVDHSAQEFARMTWAHIARS